MLLHIPALLTPDNLTRCRNLVEQADWADGNITAGTQSARAKKNRQLPEDAPAAREARQIIINSLAKNALFISAALPKKTFPPLFNRYDGESNTFGNHIDNAIRTSLTNEWIRTDISCTLFLVPPEEYEGGELIIEDTFGVQTIKLPAGDLILYPSSSIHRVQPVTHGSRIAAFFWVESMIRRDEQRRLLFEMDMAIIQLRAQSPEADEDHPVIRLTACYHNLLRQWADT